MYYLVLDEINVEKAVHFLQFGRLLKWKKLVKKRNGRKIDTSHLVVDNNLVHVKLEKQYIF
jgi:hypothetical protein